MDAGDILKIIGLIAFFIIQGVFGSKKKKKKEEAARQQAIAEAEAEIEYHQYQPEQTSAAGSEANAFFDEVKRMLEEEEKKDTSAYFEPNESESITKLDFATEDYFEKRQRENETEFFTEKISNPEIEAESQAVISRKSAKTEIVNTPAAVSTSLKNSTKKRRGLNLKKAIIYQTILEQKYS